MQYFKNIRNDFKWKHCINYLVIAAFLVLMIVLNAEGALGRSTVGMLTRIGYSIILAVSLNLVVGFLGELSLGHAGFMCVGAYLGCFCANQLRTVIDSQLLVLIIAMLIGGFAAAAFGFLVGLPALRLRGDYLAIVTLAFGEIIRNVINCLYISLDDRLHISFNDPSIPGTMLINGPQGAQGVTKISTFAMGFALILFTLFVVLNLINSRSGRAIMAIRDNRIAAESVGIGATKFKMMAFVISAALAGMAGALYSLNYSTVTASKFKFDTSILVLVFVVLGGIGNIRGSVIAAALLTVLPELLRAFSDYRMLIYAIVLIVVMLVSNNERFKQFSTSLTQKLRKGKGGGENV